MVITVSRGGYIKRSPLSLYRAQRRGGKGRIGATTKEEDVVEHLFVASTHAYVLAFTNREALARVATLGVHCPIEVSDGLSALPFATLGQLFACHLATARGLNPDAPRRLRKVTKTL